MTSRTFIIDRGGIDPRMQGRFTASNRQHNYVAHLPGYIVGVLAGVELARNQSPIQVHVPWIGN
jgi:hypothetical protein